MKSLIVALSFFIALALVIPTHADPVPTHGGAVAKAPMRTFDTPYYVLTTDLPDAMAREADLRMTRMFEEYKRRTAAFSSEPRNKFPFYLYKNAEDYYADGGPDESAGVFKPMTGRLMAIAGETVTSETWHVVQHEGFHQFAASTIHAELPAWLNEGLAEYFGEALFTGDSFVSGFIHPRRLKDVKDEIEHHQWKSFAVMTTLSQHEWNNKLTDSNYDQAWAMVHFLAHGDDGKYQKPFIQYMNLMNHGASASDAWTSVFGKDTAAFEQKCENWWMGLPDYPTQEIYEKATVLRMTSILARTQALGQSFENFDAFLANARPTDLKLSRDLWLPEKFVDTAVAMAPKIGDWVLDKPKGLPPRLLCTVSDGSTYTGSFTLFGKKITQITVTLAAPTVMKPATTTPTATKPTTTRPATKPAAKQNP